MDNFMQQEVLTAFLVTLLAGLATVIGGALVLFLGSPASGFIIRSGLFSRCDGLRFAY